MKILLITLLVISNLFYLSGIYLLSMTRADAVTLLTKLAIARKPELADTPVDSVFTDIGHLSAEQQHYIELARVIHITAGTTSTTFSPDEVAPFWQWAILYGKMVMVSH